MPPTDGTAIASMYPPASDADRATLVAWAREVPLLYGRWRHFKALYKRAELAGDEPELLAALIARIDAAASVRRPAYELRSVLPPELRYAGGVACDESRRLALVLAGQWYQPDRLQLLDISEPLRPVPLGSARQADLRSACFCGALACTLGGGARRGGQSGQLRLIDLSDPRRPRSLGDLDVGALAPNEGALAALPSGRHVAVTVRSGLQIVDVSDPAQPRLAGSIDLPEPHAVAVAGDHAYVAVGRSGFRWTGLPRRGGLQIVDVSDPARPRSVGTLDIGDPQAVAVAGGIACVTIERGTRSPVGLHTLDVSDPARPRKLGFAAGPDGPAIVLRGSHALVAGGHNGLFVVDIADPGNPRVVTRVAVGAVMDLALAGDYALLAASWGGLEIADVSNPAHPVRSGEGPSAETLAYMKRRARRFLRHFAGRSPERYVQIAAGLLAESGRGRESLDLQHQWVSLDVLFGSSDRYVQRRHGRGSFVLGAPRLRLRTREESAPAAWDRRPDLARALYLDPNLPWQTHEAALKILRANRVEIPDPDAATLLRFLRSPSPLLNAAATRPLVRQIEAGETVDAEAAALGYLLAPAHLRRRMRARLPGYAATGHWAGRFARALFEHAVTGPGQEIRLSRRAVGAATLLAREFAREIPAESVLPALARLLNADQPELSRLALNALEQVPAAFARQWLAALAPVTGAAREPALGALERAMSGQSFNLDIARALVTDADEAIREAAWRLLAASRTEEATLTALWQELLAAVTETPALRTAFRAPAALTVLGRARLDSAYLSARLAESPWLVRLFGPETFVRITGTASASLTVALIAAAPDDLWQTLRGPWLPTLDAPDRLAAFWKAAFAALREESESGGGPLAARFLEDAVVAQTFLQIEDASLLETSDDPQLGPLLLRWARAHEAQFLPDSPLLLAAATHAAPEVRDWSLLRVRALGMGLPFALRLLESGLPPAVATSRDFFEAAGPGDERALEYALALCDSPQENARAYGREFVAARRDTLPADTLLARLFENPDPAMQAFVAGLLEKSERRPDATPVFDRAVLRSRNRARRAKERVKERQSEEPTLDVATLLELARSRTPRDREWALAELAKRALAGETIEGLVVDGVAGV